MKRRNACLAIVLIISSLSSVAFVSADTMVITYRSGQVQHVAMDLPSGEVKDIGYLKAAVPSSEIKPKELPDKPAEKGGGKEQSSEKKGVTIQWAPPME